MPIQHIYIRPHVPYFLGLFSSSKPKLFATEDRAMATDDSTVQETATQDFQSLALNLTDSVKTAIEEVNASVDKKLEAMLKSVDQKIERLSTNRGAHSSTPSSTHTPENWGDRMDRHDRGDESLPLDGEAVLTWSDDGGEEDESDQKKSSLSEETTGLVKAAFSKTLPNASRRETRGRCPVPCVPQTRCPRVDPIFKAPESRFSTNTEAKQVDNDLQKLQAYMLDVAAPLLELAEAAESPSNTTLPRDPKEMVMDALTLLGNAVTQTSKVRRKRILKICNQDIQDLAEEEDLFLEASPNLFGREFEKQMKERAESVKLLSKSQQRSGSQSGSNSFFRKGRPFQTQKGGGLSYRGGRARYNPMGSQRTQSSYHSRGNWQKSQAGK